ncbi:CPBP family intramembrane glutamic endopeptidase [Bifidobacterium sp. ESL0704]|uniref:CPBP family intramembrane glutamic endopeptidase n=1 Tax=Bifidobacterium sp. ESL0704 TaxID=2983219 RepID=UPI0023F952AF|nr:CPBP family intramembrane glutamic endopeptidase [Bifidobacterium sp. ESL0704]WEV52322.1 CPBP family intramembrane metalloprotease [Bifidobacterium sp. ESL0704]
MQEDGKGVPCDVATSTSLSEDGNNAVDENEYVANNDSVLSESNQPQDTSTEVALANTVWIANAPNDSEREIDPGLSGDSATANSNEKSSAQGEQRTPEQIRRKAVGHQAAIVWGFFLVWAVLQVLAGIFGSLGKMDSPSLDAWINLFTEPIAVLVVLLATGTLSRSKSTEGKANYHCAIRFSSRKTITWKELLIIVVTVTAVSAVGDVFGSGFQGLLDMFGLKQHDTMTEIDTMVNHSMIGLLDVVLIGPVIEELLMRGIIMSALERYGRIFAIVTSSLLFGFMHGDISQGFAAVLYGLELGWIACEYSIGWSIAMHIFNNLVLAEGLNALFAMLNDPMSSILEAVFDGFFIVLAIALLICNRRKVAAWYRDNKTPRHTYRGWQSPLFIFTLVAFGLFALSRIGF